MMREVAFKVVALFSVIIVAITPCGDCQREPSLPFNLGSFRQILRSTVTGYAPKGRSANYKDVILRFYGSNSMSPTSSYRLGVIKLMLAEPGFDRNKSTVVYAHGYVELITDDSVQSIVSAYHQNGEYNVLILDWANLAFGNYLSVVLDVPTVGEQAGAALYRLIKNGLAASSVHLVGHSLGAHVMGYAARYLKNMGIMVPRISALDPAYPGYYPGFAGQAVSSRDAVFVDALHTDAGGFGAPSRSAHADFWPAGGVAKQPGCLSATIPFTVEDFCSHWRSWQYWAESVRGGEFLARRCRNYDEFLRGRCREAPLVYMGLKATPDLRGNFYLHTGTKEPYALGVAGAD